MNIPPTSNILEAIKDFFINHTDPSQMGIDVYDGLKEKEEKLKALTHQAICDAIGETKYLELEGIVNDTIGKDGILSILSGDADSLINASVSYPSIQFYITDDDSSSSSSAPDLTIIPNKYYSWFFIANGGTISLLNFEPTITIVNKPNESDVDIILDNRLDNESYIEQVGDIRFSMAGLYSIELKLQHRNQERLQIISYINVKVE